MGREAECSIRWGEERVHGKVLLEATELILRGGVRRRVPLSALDEVSVRGDKLLFAVEGVPVALALGAERSHAWMEAIRTPPPDLAKKLGIKVGSHVLAWGAIDADELRVALAVGVGATVDLVLIRASTPLELEHGLGDCWDAIDGGCPLWVVYPKGKASSLGETAVREKMRGLGWIDTKVASVSSALTGLRFVRQKG